MKIAVCFLLLASCLMVSSRTCSSREFYVLQRGNVSIICDNGRYVFFVRRVDFIKVPLNCKRQQLVKWIRFYMECHMGSLTIWGRAIRTSHRTSLNSWSDKYKDLTGYDNWTTPF